MDNILTYFFMIITIIILLYLLGNGLSNYFGSNPSKTIHPSILYKKVENAYIALSNSLYHNSNQKELEYDLKKMVRRRSDGRYFGGYSNDTNEFNWKSFTLDLLYDLVRYNEKRKIDFIFDLDRSVSLDQLNGFFKQLLQDKVALDYDLEQSSFPYTNTLVAYKKELNKNGIEVAFFTDGTNSYYLFLFPLSQEKKVQKSIANIGFQYQVIPVEKEEVINPTMAVI